MTSLLARALVEDHPEGDPRDPRRGADRVLLSTFWRSSPQTAPGVVIALDFRSTDGDGSSSG
jgi:hypothetical protein